MVYWCLVSEEWCNTSDYAKRTCDRWNARCWGSCQNNLYMVVHICIVTITSQIDPWVSLKTGSTRSIEHRVQFLSSPWGATELSNIGTCRQMICAILSWSVHCWWNASCHIHRCGYTGCHIWNQLWDKSTNTREQSSNAIFPGILDFMCLSLWVH